MSGNTDLIPAAQYLRVSLSRQECSLQDQVNAIAEYAAGHGLQIIQTYRDVGRSGVVLRRRRGLQSLLRDVVSQPHYKVILVFDVSRWGRFQDADEAAHYEFICQTAGIPVVYCGEQFPEQGSLAESILKTIKRVMAGEYSRELGDKVLRAQIRLAAQGFAMGGPVRYGLRRLLVSSTGRPSLLLGRGERKRVTGDRVLYVPGPPQEVAVVRQMFDLVLSRGYGPTQIARHLNSNGIPFPAGRSWSWATVTGLLRDTKYAGDVVWRRGTVRLNQAYRRLPASEWVVAERVIEPVIEPSVFAEVQRRLQPLRWTKATVLQSLATALSASRGRERSVTDLLRRNKHLPSATTIERLFGSIPDALMELGIVSDHRVGSAHRRQSHRLQARLLSQAQASHPSRIQIAAAACGLKQGLLIDGVHRVMVVQAQPFSRVPGAWQLRPTPEELQNFCLCCLLSNDYEKVEAMYLVSGFDRQQQTYLVRPGGASLRKAVPVFSFEELCDVVCATMREHRQCPVLAVRQVSQSGEVAS